MLIFTQNKESLFHCYIMVTYMIMVVTLNKVMLELWQDKMVTSIWFRNRAGVLLAYTYNGKV